MPRLGTWSSAVVVATGSRSSTARLPPKSGQADLPGDARCQVATHQDPAMVDDGQNGPHHDPYLHGPPEHGRVHERTPPAFAHRPGSSCELERQTGPYTVPAAVPLD